MATKGKARDRYVDFLIEQFSPLGKITDRAMFGGYCLYCDGYVFGLVGNAELYLKADEKTVGDFEARGLRAFAPFEEQAMTMSYYQAPPEIFEDEAAMRQWVGGAVECGRRNYKPRKKKQSRTPGKGGGS
ncbi:TfoX/Sxy family protein [Nostoc sp. NIES-2111]